MTFLTNDTDVTAVAEHETAQMINKSEPPFPLKLIVISLLLMSLFVGVLVTWTMFAPLESAVVSRGLLSVAGHRKKVQHLEGGIIQEIFVRDGDQVKKGQILIQLRDIQPQAKLRQLERQHIEIQAIIARLISERDKHTQIQFPEALKAEAQTTKSESVLIGQKTIFKTRQALSNDKHSVLKHKIAQKKEQIIGLLGQIKAQKRQKYLIKEELKTVSAAIKKSLLPKAEGLKLRQRIAKLDGKLSKNKASIQQQQQAILEVRLQMSETQAQFITDVNENLRSQYVELDTFEQKILSAKDILKRTKIISPIEGSIVNLAVYTMDGVIAAGQPLLEIVPSDDEIVVNTFISPQNIEEIRTGMFAEIKLTALSRRERVGIKGIVASVSADRVSGEALNSSGSYYLARVELLPGYEEQFGVTLISGMAADVFILTGSRTPLDYLLAPITKSLQLGFKEK